MIKEHHFGEAVVSSRRKHDIEEQETGVELVSKLLQIVSIANYAQGQPAPRESFILLLRTAARNNISLYTIARVPLAWAANISLQIQAPCRGESFVSLLCPTLAIPHHCFFFHTNSSANELRITPPFFQA